MGICAGHMVGLRARANRGYGHMRRGMGICGWSGEVVIGGGIWAYAQWSYVGGGEEEEEEGGGEGDRAALVCCGGLR